MTAEQIRSNTSREIEGINKRQSPPQIALLEVLGLLVQLTGELAAQVAEQNEKRPSTRTDEQLDWTDEQIGNSK